MYKNPENIIDTILSLDFNDSLGRYIEALSKRTELTLKEYKDIMKDLNLN